jgi:hypothetical protein
MSLLLIKKAIGMLKEKGFRSIYDDFLKSGLTVRDYCLNQKMGEARFFFWQNKRWGLLPTKNGFVPVVFSGDQLDCTKQLPASLKNRQVNPIIHTSSAADFSREICSPNRIIVKFNKYPGPEIIHTLLDSMHR